jgi:hypothetical protein
MVGKLREKRSGGWRRYFPYVGKRPVAEILPLEMLEVLRLIEKRGSLEKLRGSPLSLQCTSPKHHKTQV